MIHVIVYGSVQSPLLFFILSDWLLLVQYASDRYGDRHFDTKIHVGTRYIYTIVPLCR